MSVRIKQEILEEESSVNTSWIDIMDNETSFECDKIKREFKENCDNAILDFDIKREFLHVKQELDEDSTNDSSRSCESDHRLKSKKKTAFKRSRPYRSARSTAPQTATDLDMDPNAVIQEERYETDPVTLSRRQKQIDFGKNTIGYDNYIKTVKKKQRSKDDPITPKKHLKYSRRAWDGLIKQWRLRLHNYDEL